MSKPKLLEDITGWLAQDLLHGMKITSFLVIQILESFKPHPKQIIYNFIPTMEPVMAVMKIEMTSSPILKIFLWTISERLNIWNMKLSQ